MLVSNLGAGHGKFVDISYGDTLLLEFTLADGYILCNSGYSYNSSTKVYSTAVVVSSDLTFTPTAVTYTGPVNPQVRPGMGEYTEEVWFKATNNNNEQLRLVVNFTSLHVYQYDLGHDTDVAPWQSFWDIPANTTRDNMTVIWLGMDGGKWYSYEYEAHFEKEVRTGYGNWVQCSPSTYVSWSS